MNVSEVFIRRPIATALLMAAICLFGMVGYELLPVAALPNVEFPTIVVDRAVARRKSRQSWRRPLRRRWKSEFTQIPGLSQMTSTSGLGHDLDNPAVRSQRRHQRRRRPSAAGNQCCERAVAEDPADAADVSGN